jgi:hypothetical protein
MDYVRMAAKKFVLVDLLSFNPTHEYFLNYFMQCFSYAQFVSLLKIFLFAKSIFFNLINPIHRSSTVDRISECQFYTSNICIRMQP